MTGTELNDALQFTFGEIDLRRLSFGVCFGGGCFAFGFNANSIPFRPIFVFVKIQLEDTPKRHLTSELSGWREFLQLSPDQAS